MMGSLVETHSAWHGCYESSWKRMITPESFAHPAKFSRDLIERIFDHCLERGWLRRGDLVGDCFGGIGTGGVTAAYRGIRWIGCELESRFVTMAGQNFDLHACRWDQLRFPKPQIVQGDSRRFHEVIGSTAAVITSPPFSAPNMQPTQGGQGHRNTHGDKRDGFKGDRTSGNIETLKAGDVAAVITSPPYADGLGHGDSGREINQTKGLQNGVYGRTDGQISGLKSGTIDGVVTSPPWESQEGAMKGSKLGFVPSNGKGHHANESAKAKQLRRAEAHEYGSAAGQIGNQNGETYWQAMAQVYASCFLAIRPGGVIACVVKDYVKNKQRVPLCDDTARLLEHCGFTTIERVRAMLVKESRHADLFGADTVKRSERKSFFRRLAEKKGSPRIDFEEVIFAQKL